MTTAAAAAQDTTKAGDQTQNQPVTTDQLHDQVIAATDAYEKEQDPTKKEELWKTVKETSAKAKEVYTGEKTTAQKAAEEAAAKAKPPEKYELKIPKDSLLSQADIDKVSSFAKEKGLSNDVAQTLLEQRSQAVADFHSGQLAALETRKTEWLESCKTDKEIGGEKFNENAELASRVINHYASEDLKKQLNETGLGNYPELVRMIARIGRDIGEDKLVLPGSQTNKAEKKSIESRLYGTEGAS